MPKLYSLYIPKHYDFPSSLPDIIGDFLYLSNGMIDEVVISPGYLGGGSDFISKVRELFFDAVREVTIYKGMTQNDRFRRTIDDISVVMNDRINGIPGTVDHRKMMFFRDNNNTIAVLLGSSNFSNTTYFSRGGKGEADILFFCNENLKVKYYDVRVKRSLLP